MLPTARFIPLETFEDVLALAQSGATVVSLKAWPADIAGLADLETRRARFRSATDSVQFGPTDADGIREAVIGRGRIFRGDDLGRLLTRAGVRRERMVDQACQFARRVDALGRFYFVSNPGEQAIDGWVPFESTSPSFQIFDPMNGRQGSARVRSTAGGSNEVYLQIPRGGSLIVAASPAPATETFDNYRSDGASVPIAGPWMLRFTKGGPALPSGRSIAGLSSWTALGEDAATFSGTASYTATFPRPSGRRGPWQLDLGQVRESARVRLNGRDLGTLIGPQFRVVVGSGTSIAGASRGRSSTTSTFQPAFPRTGGPTGCSPPRVGNPLESGLLGPVTLTPLSVIR